MIDIDQPPLTETAVLARVILPNESEHDVDESLDEMRQLAWTAGADIRATFLQRRDKPCPSTLLGSGKVADIKAACEELDVDFVIVDSELTPTQGSNLEKQLDRKVVDRTQLILDIFAQRAHTNEGKLQVELAQLQYILPRLSGRGSIMRQQGGIGVRGPGEQKLEVDRRVIRLRIQRLREELEHVRQARHVQRKRRARADAYSVALVGYTNAGKSSLLNAVSDADVFVEDKLFATLDTRSRTCPLPGGSKAVFSDTVGFIRKLPHGLVAAFRATLEEVTEADLLLLVMDAAHPAAEEHLAAVHVVLKEIGADEKEMIHVLNKADVADPQNVNQLRWKLAPSVVISARTGEGLPRLLELVEARLASTRRLVTFRIPQKEAGVVTRVHECGRVIDQSYEEQDVVLKAEVDHALAEQLARFIV
jgi:GTP-binding protein HflX